MRNFFVILIFCLISFYQASAQFYRIKGEKPEKNEPIHKMAIKVVPSQFFSRFSSFMGAFEHQVDSLTTLQHSVGIILNDQTYNQDNFFENKRGVKLASQIRFYKKTWDPYNRWFLAVEPYLTAVNYDRTRVFEVSCGFAGCSYYQESKFSLKESRKGGRLRVGYMGYLTTKLSLEVDVAMAYERWTITPTGMPKGVITSQDGFSYRDQAFEWRTNADLAFRLAYFIK